MIEFKINRATVEDIYKHLLACNNLFVPILSEKVDLQKYSAKLFGMSETFEAWDNKALIGLVAAYFNNLNTKKAFITNVSVEKNYSKKGIASNLLLMTHDFATRSGYETISLEVSLKNEKAINFYKKNNYIITSHDDDSLYMEQKIKL